MNIEQLLKVVEHNYEMGFGYHIAQTGKIPDRIALYSIDNKKWENFLTYIKRGCRWDKENFIKNEEHKSDGTVVKTTLIHLENSVTIFQAGNSAFLYSDPQIENETISDIKERFISIEQEKSKSRNIGIIVSRGAVLDVQTFEYSLPENSIIEYLDPQTKQFHRDVTEQLGSKDGSGLYLMYGKPGTGKTSFIKDVLSKTKKQALFISPFFTESLTSPDLISLLMNYPDSILVIEDAETVLMERKADNSSAVSNLLNLTDGFLADFLNLKIICTFNTDLNNIDEALLREGRMKGMHEFTKIKPERAQKIANVLGSDINFTSPVTLAEICADKNISYDFKTTKIGFDNFPIEKPFN